MFPMLSLGMSIGKKHHALMKAWARVFNVIQIKILHVTTYTAKLYNHTIPKKESQKTCFNFWGFEVEWNKQKYITYVSLLLKKAIIGTF